MEAGAEIKCQKCKKRLKINVIILNIARKTVDQNNVQSASNPLLEAVIFTSTLTKKSRSAITAVKNSVIRRYTKDI